MRTAVRQSRPRISAETASGGATAEPDSRNAEVDAAMERYANGDEAAFAEVYDAIAPRLLAFLRRATRDESAAEDLMQQTLLQMHRARGSFIPGAAVTPWAFAIARRLIIDGARRRRVERRIFADTSTDEMTYEPIAPTAAAEEVVHARRLQRRVEQRLESLPEIQQTAYRLLQQEGLTLKAAADALGTSVTAVKLRAHRAYRALRIALREPESAS
jgi:RNA polymerase sigma-70 factor, ECF subfamily